MTQLNQPTAQPGSPETPGVTAILSRRQRRALGITIRQLRPVYDQYREAGEITEDMGRETVAAILLQHQLLVHKEEFAKISQEVQLDWDSLLDFIISILPLLLLLV